MTPFITAQTITQYLCSTFGNGKSIQKQPSKRSILFVIHGAEERGLLGSRWHAAHPVVPKESIVAVLNGDMIGRNDNNEAALL
jgi:Zn-dependent M28 family amino/carboxypeptidase